MHDDLTTRRLAVLDQHFQSEVDHDWATCLSTFASTPRYEIVPTGRVYEGHEAVTQYHTQQRTSFPDQRHEHVRRHVASDDTIICEFDLIGTNTGPFAGAAPTGRTFRVPVVAIFHFEGERIVNERVYLDTASMMRQIGREDLLEKGGRANFSARNMTS